MPSRIRVSPRPLGDLVDRFGGRLVGGQDVRALVAGLSPIDLPRPSALVPLTRVRSLGRVDEALRVGGVVVVDERLGERSELDARPRWVHPKPMQVVAELLREAEVDDLSGDPGEGTDIAPSAVIGPRVRLGKRVKIGPGAVIGAPGFGFEERESGLLHVPQLGGVVVEDDVWIGANTTIDSGTLGPTRIGRGVKIDAHVHVGHNVIVGEHSVLCAQVGLAGSVVIGRGCVLGGQVGVADHVHVGDGAKIAAKSGVIGDVPSGAVVAGYPAVGRAKWLRGLAALYRLGRRRDE
jgi:UDP-3-O-[3-hydroxymyristoyl] glucosamine N-acyltransferase